MVFYGRFGAYLEISLGNIFESGQKVIKICIKTYMIFGSLKKYCSFVVSS
jgi:hypothetical protein